MEDRTSLFPDAPSGKWPDTEIEGLAKPSILLVEDDGDTRELLIMLLGIAGFDTVPCGTAEEALEHLRESPYDLVLTDYCLPHRTGGWLLKQASAEGLLDSTPGLVVTAHPTPADTEGFEVICKPFDLDGLVERVRQRLTGARSESRKTNGASASGRSGDGGDDDCPEPIELILYVRAQLPRSASAIQDVKAVLSRFDSSRIRLTICNLSQSPAAHDEDGAALTATLVKRSAGPRTLILGHLRSPALLLELLEECEES